MTAFARNLARLLQPQSVAIVGASDKRAISNNAVLPMLRAGLRPHLITPNHATQYGLPTSPSLSAIGYPVDAVLALVNADMSTDLVAEAGQLGCGGVVVVAGGFAEQVGAGVALQDRLAAAARAHDLAVMGPNCSGFVNVAAGVRLFTGGELELRPGGIAVISQSGFLTRSAMTAAYFRQLGVRVAISSGNEAVCGLTDYLAWMVADPQTLVICLVLETVRDPAAFFAVLAATQAAGKPVIALKLGRTARAQDIVQSHTGAIADEAWIYDVALRQAGVLLADDIDAMLDQASLFAQLPRSKWRATRRLAALTTSGGAAALAADLSGAEPVISLPDLPAMQAWVDANVPGSAVANPLDMTGFLVGNGAVVAEMFQRFADCVEVDATVLAWWAGPDDESWARALTVPFAAEAARSDKPAILTTVEQSPIGAWAADLRDSGVAVCGGLRATLRAAGAMARYMDRGYVQDPPLPVPPAVPRPSCKLVATPAGNMLPFVETLALLRAHDIPVAPYVLASAGDPADLARRIAPLGAQLVIKLANLAHRTELGAVRVRVAPQDAAGVVAELQRLARREKLDDTVVIQSFASGLGEAFVGVRTDTHLGPLIVFGLGGVLVEITKRVEGRMLPASARELDAMLDAIGGQTVFAGLRGQAAWDRAALRELVLKFAGFGLACAEWATTIELNPVICSTSGCVAVDAVCMLKA